MRGFAGPFFKRAPCAANRKRQAVRATFVPSSRGCEWRALARHLYRAAPRQARKPKNQSARLRPMTRPSAAVPTRHATSSVGWWQTEAGTSPPFPKPCLGFVPQSPRNRHRKREGGTGPPLPVPRPWPGYVPPRPSSPAIVSFSLATTNKSKSAPLALRAESGLGLACGWGMMLGLSVTGLQAGTPLASILGLGVTILGLDSLRRRRQENQFHVAATHGCIKEKSENRMHRASHTAEWSAHELGAVAVASRRDAAPPPPLAPQPSPPAPHPSPLAPHPSPPFPPSLIPCPSSLHPLSPILPPLAPQPSPLVPHPPTSRPPSLPRKSCKTADRESKCLGESRRFL